MVLVAVGEVALVQLNRVFGRARGLLGALSTACEGAGAIRLTQSGSGVLLGVGEQKSRSTSRSSSRRAHFLGISGVFQSGVHAECFISGMIGVAFGGLVCRVMEDVDHVVG